MYKKLIITTYFLVSTLSACEFVNGVTIQEPKVAWLFNTASTECQSNPNSLQEVEELRMQYLCLIALYGEREVHAKEGSRILEQVRALIQSG